MSRESDFARRTVVKALGAGAGLAAGFGAAGTASADGSNLDVGTEDCTCYNDYRCDTSRFCSDSPDPSQPYQYQVRECCDCDDDTVCEDTWTDVEGGCCSG